MRVAQDVGKRGSLRWVQELIGPRRELADAAIREALQPDSGVSIDWRSPLSGDGNAEYRDSDFLERLGLGELRPMLGSFWPRGGPQWDALARLSDGKIVLVEAKAHAGELRSHCAASPEPRKLIESSLTLARSYFGAPESSDWTRNFYQYANRLAHLYFLKTHEVDAHLVFIYFLNDREMGGPASASAWTDVVAGAHAALGLSAPIPDVHDCYIDTAILT